MSYARRAAGLALLAATVAVIGVSGRRTDAQAMMSPTNDAPNPYQSIEGWAKLPEGRTWGSTSAVEVGTLDAAHRGAHHRARAREHVAHEGKVLAGASHVRY